jgi:signal transduction histidine kinase
MDRAKMVASIIEENLQNAALTAATVDTIVTTFLHDKARFIEYLDGIEPMHQQELAALSRETGLLGITLIRPGNRVLAAPENWLPVNADCSRPDGLFDYLKQQKIAYLVHQAEGEDQDLSCIVTGLDGTDILALQQKTSLPALLRTLTALPGITFIHLDQEEVDTRGNTTPSKVTLLRRKDTMTARATLQTSLGKLEVGLDAHFFQQRQQAIRSQFIIFGTVLLLLGVFFSWLLYHLQQRTLQQATLFEREMAREHEAATLGRTTATIAHEVRNPLNAINMGLQRLQMESDNLDQDQQEMLSAMRDAVDRTSTIVTELQRFARELQPMQKPVSLKTIVEQILTLYKKSCQDQGIKITTAFKSSRQVTGDKELLAELVENLLKNSIEAQPDGGCITITINDRQDQQILTMTNAGFSLTGRDRERPGEPYFTSKTRGTGLGLALCRRIAEAHEGQLNIVAETDNRLFTVRVSLPVYAQ